MKEKTRYILAAVGAFVLGALWLASQVGYYSTDRISWFKFPWAASTPMVELVHYKGECLYCGFGEHTADINLNYDNLIYIDNLSKEVLYDTKARCFVPKERLLDYHFVGERIRNRDNAYICDFYSLMQPDDSLEWRQRIYAY